MGNLHLVLLESDVQGGDQFTSHVTYRAEKQTPGSSMVVNLKYLLSCPNQLVCSEHRHLCFQVLS